MGKACSKGAGYDERLDVQAHKVKRYNTEENQGQDSYSGMRAASMASNPVPRPAAQKKGSFVLDDSEAYSQIKKDPTPKVPPKKKYGKKPEVQTVPTRRPSTVPLPPTNVKLPPPPRSDFTAVSSEAVAGQVVPPPPSSVIVPPPLPQGNLGIVRTKTAFIPESQKPPPPANMVIPPPLPDKIREIMAIRIHQTFKRVNERQKQNAKKIAVVFASRSADSCLTESSYGKDMHNELIKKPLSTDKVQALGNADWVENFQDESYLYTGQMKDGLKEGVGRLQSDQFLYDGEFKNDLFCGYGRYILDWEGDDKDFWYEGQFKNGEMNGKGIRTLKDGRIEEGTFERDEFVMGHAI